MCGNKRGWRNKGDTWWWNEEVKEAVSRKKEAHKVIIETVMRRMRRGIKA